jgi:hypothetical protein
VTFGRTEPDRVIYLSTGRPVTITRRRLDVQLSGEARAKFVGGSFTGGLTILSLTLRPQQTAVNILSGTVNWAGATNVGPFDTPSV